MEVIIDRKLYDEIWEKIYADYSFSPSVDRCGTWLEPIGVSKCFKLLTIWNQEQEELVNWILCEVINGEMYALDWQHDCFLFSPREKIPFEHHYYDAERDCEVSFPEYYPNGDYHFFISKDWTFGLFGHPWRKELIVVGEPLISAIQKNLVELDLEI